MGDLSDFFNDAQPGRDGDLSDFFSDFPRRVLDAQPGRGELDAATAPVGPDDKQPVPYSGRDRELLDLMVAPHRRRGCEIDLFFRPGQRVQRVIRVVDPRLPEAIRTQEYVVPIGSTWRDGLAELGLVNSQRPSKVPSSDPRVLQSIYVGEVPAVVNAFFAFESLREASLTVRLHGQGADEPVSAPVQLLVPAMATSPRLSFRVRHVGNYDLLLEGREQVLVARAMLNITI